MENKYFKELINSLPTDEDIETAAAINCRHRTQKLGYAQGAKWLMRELKSKIKATEYSIGREVLIDYEIHMLNPTEKEHRKYWAERTVDHYLSNL